MLIRKEKPEDIQRIRQINIKAFDTDGEADLVDALRDSRIPLISLVAEENGELVGHILFSPVTLDDNNSQISIAALAPVAIVPEYQKRGIGSHLVVEGLKCCQESGCEAVIVLGHARFYSRFGFVPSVNYGIKSEYDVPAEVFMIKELKDSALKGCSGIIKYHGAFSNL
jgi:putative acetyltransferase